MLVLVRKATPQEITQMAAYYDGYIKVVIDIEKKVLVGGAEKHVDEEKILLKIGSQQENLWGGGIDWETKEIDYNSMINLRPLQNNPSRDILATEIRTKFHAILTELLL
ncbi:TPA: hypothetical protein DIV55_06870 [Patescibacteria group bacterium]|nr:hypothetical protein [Patescibacteria group bacterium]